VVSPPEPADRGDELAAPPLACAYLSHFALQLLGRRDPACLEHPAVVVSEDRPQGVVREANRLARAARVLPGMRYAAALALCADLRAGVVEDTQERIAADELCDRLRQLSPRVEPSQLEPGVFWLDASGLGGLWPDLQHWAQAIRDELALAGLQGSVAVGWSRFAVYALARQVRGVAVSADPQSERQRLGLVRLNALGAALGLPPALRDALALLGVHTLGQFLSLAPEDLRERYGETALQLHRRARDQLIEPLRPLLPAPPLQLHRDVEPPDDQRDRLLFIAKGLLVDLLKTAASQHSSVASLHLRLELERPWRNRQRDRGQEGPAEKPADSKGKSQPLPAAQLVQTAVQTAEPSLYEPQWLELLRLRLDSLELPARVERLGLRAEVVPATAQQLRLWQLLAEAGGLARRDLAAASEALIKLRAALGDDVVLRAEPRSAHLPEARFRLLPWQGALPAAKIPAGIADPPPLVRRLLPRPQVLPSRPKHEPDGWLLADWRQGAVSKLWGPFRFSGGWWGRPAEMAGQEGAGRDPAGRDPAGRDSAGSASRGPSEVRRDYWYVLTERGDLLWVFYDHVRKLWFLHGTVA
jgi:protein ImuB